MALTAPDFSQRVPIQFIVPDNTANNITPSAGNVLLNNPSVFAVTPGNTPKVDLGINGTSYFTGQGEYAPFALDFTWAQLAYSDYVKLAQLSGNLVQIVTFRNIGYYGKWLMNGPTSVMKAGDVVSTDGTLVVLSPCDAGGAQAVTRLPVPPSVTAVPQANGFIRTAAPNYYWLTFSTIWGETTNTAVHPVTSSDYNRNLISWAWPTSAYVKRCNIYVSSTNDYTTACLLDEVESYEQPYYIDLVGAAGATLTQAPPPSNSAYCGQWQSGVWWNEGS